MGVRVIALAAPDASEIGLAYANRLASSTSPIAMASSETPQTGATSAHGPAHEPEGVDPEAPPWPEHRSCACQTLSALLDGPSGTNRMIPPLAALDGLSGTNSEVPPRSTSMSPTATRATRRPPGACAPTTVPRLTRARFGRVVGRVALPPHPAAPVSAATR